MVTKTAFSSNAGSTTGAVSVFSGQMDGLARLVRSQPFRELNVFMNQLGLGDFQHLIDNFDLDGFNRLAVKLYALKTNTHVGKELGVLRQEITKLRAENSILHNVTLLREYLETLTKRTFTIFKEQRVTTSKIKLRPEYELYIQRYGFPKNGAFDAQLLAEIINELKARLQPISCAVPSAATGSAATVPSAATGSGSVATGSGSASECVPCSNNA
jgi:hypothetical protein